MNEEMPYRASNRAIDLVKKKNLSNKAIDCLSIKPPSTSPSGWCEGGRWRIQAAGRGCERQGVRVSGARDVSMGDNEQV